MSNRVPMMIITLHLILAGILKVWESTTQENLLKTVSVVGGIITLGVGLGFITRKKIFIISALVIIVLPLLMMPFVVGAYFPLMKFACIGICIFFVPFFAWEISVLRSELKHKSNHRLEPVPDDSAHTLDSERIV